MSKFCLQSFWYKSSFKKVIVQIEHPLTKFIYRHKNSFNSTSFSFLVKRKFRNRYNSNFVSGRWFFRGLLWMPQNDIPLIPNSPLKKFQVRFHYTLDLNFSSISSWKLHFHLPLLIFFAGSRSLINLHLDIPLLHLSYHPTLQTIPFWFFQQTFSFFQLIQPSAFHFRNWAIKNSKAK